MEDNSIICRNCGKIGHKLKLCTNPITSFGIICINYHDLDLFEMTNTSRFSKYPNNIMDKKDYKLMLEKLNNEIQILLICRKDTIGFIEFLRGKYKLEDEEYILKLFNIMTIKERQKILSSKNNFDILWIKLWSIDNHNVNSKKIETEYPKAKIKFKKFLEKYNINDILSKVTSNWENAEWGFPKGRRNNKEKDVECAKREFEEETNFTSDDYQILNIKPIFEIYKGEDNQIYKHIYYVAQSKKKNLEISNTNIHQATEISKLVWTSYSGALNLIRDYHKDKKKALNYLFNILKNIIINYEQTEETLLTRSPTEFVASLPNPE